MLDQNFMRVELLNEPTGILPTSVYSILVTWATCYAANGQRWCPLDISPDLFEQPCTLGCGRNPGSKYCCSRINSDGQRPDWLQWHENSPEESQHSWLWPTIGWEAWMATKDTDQFSRIPPPALTHTLVISTQHPFLNFGIGISILRLQPSHQQKKHAKEATLFIVEYPQTQTS